MATIRAGLIGIGHFGGHMALPALQRTPGVEVVAVCSTDRARARAFADERGVPEAHDRVDDIVARDDIDLVLVCTPPRLHTAMSRAALSAGHHVFSTKPLAPTVEEAGDLHELAVAQGVVTAMDLDSRYLPVRRHFRELVRAGYLGDVRCVCSNVFWGLATDPGNRIYYWNWTGMRAESGGLLGASLLLHHLDLLRFTFGEVEHVDGLTRTFITEKPVLAPGESQEHLGVGTPTVGMRTVDAEDTAILHGQFVGGGVFSMTGSWSVHHGTGIRLEAYGSDGSLVLEPGGRLLGCRAGDPGLAELPIPEHLVGPATRAATMSLLFADVVAAIHGEAKDPLFATFEDGLRTSEIAAAVMTDAR